MTSLVLLGWAAAVVALARPVLTAPWMTSLPRLTIGLWLGAELSITVAVLTAGLLVAVPPDALATGLASIVAACKQALASLGTPNATLAVIGLVATAVLAVRLVIGLVVTFTGAPRWRRRHLATLLPLGRHDVNDGWTLVDHATPAVYCLPGRPAQVVVTSAAIDALTDQEFAAALRHERAHLRGRHHLLVALAVAFHRALPGLPMADAAEEEIRRLVEHLADDRASERHGRHAVATAIVQLADRTPRHAISVRGRARPSGYGGCWLRPPDPALSIAWSPPAPSDCSWRGRRPWRLPLAAWSSTLPPVGSASHPPPGVPPTPAWQAGDDLDPNRSASAAN